MGEGENNGAGDVQPEDCSAEKSAPEQNNSDTVEDAVSGINAELEVEGVDDKENVSAQNVQLNDSKEKEEAVDCYPESEGKAEVDDNDPVVEQEDVLGLQEDSIPREPSLSGLEEVGYLMHLTFHGKIYCKQRFLCCLRRCQNGEWWSC